MLELFESLKSALKAESGYEFELKDAIDKATKINYKLLLRKYDLESLPTILRVTQKSELREHYSFKNAKTETDWERDWKDNNPTSIDCVEVWLNKVIVRTLGEFPIRFMTRIYYGVAEVIFEPREELYTSREDKMKLGRYVPAVVKDIEVALKIMNEISGANASKFEFVSYEGNFLDPFLFSDFGIKSEFSTKEMSKEEIIENCLKRVKVMSEWRRRFRTWLSSIERKQYYESTKGHLDVFMRERKGWVVTGGVNLVKWPVKDRNTREKIINHHIYRCLSHGAPIFTLDGYGIVGYRINHDYKFKFWVDRKQKKFRKLSLIPLEKIEFLKEDFPEMFK